MYFHFAFLGCLALMITIGLFARAASGLFCLGFAYVFLLEKARYMNHFYLIILVCLLMAFMPTDRAFSVRSRFWPRYASKTTPAWTIFLLQFQFGIAYFYAGIAKLHPDWLNGTVMTQFLSYKTDFPLVGQWFGESWLIFFSSYAALLFDLFVVPLLFWRKTRLLALVAAGAFHFINSHLFHIDIFPWLMMGATVILFVPNWLPFRSTLEDREADPVSPPPLWYRQCVIRLIAVYVAIQILVPLRHYAYPGDVAWTNEGEQFSWRMLARVKSGSVPRFLVRYQLKGRLRRSEVPIPREPNYWRQHWQFRKMLLDPDMILQFCHLSADHLRKKGADEIDIRALVPVSLNGRSPQLLIDPKTNLAAESRSFSHKRWILPLDHPSPSTQ